jgi:hypothetical protein
MAASRAQAPADRPGCVTLYALALWLFAGAFLLAACYLGFGALTLFNADPAVAGALVAIGLGMAALSFAAGLGLWNMSRYGWALVVLWLLADIAGGVALLSLIVSDMVLQDPITLVVGGALVGLLLINGGILLWFLRNRRRFGLGSDRPEGELELSRRGRLAILALGGLAVAFLSIGILLLAPEIFGPGAGRGLARLLERIGEMIPGGLLE